MGGVQLGELDANASKVKEAKTLVSRALPGWEDVGCEPLGPRWQNSYGCPFDVRRLVLKGPAQGNLTLVGPGYEREPDWSDERQGANASVLTYDQTKQAYTALVMAGGHYSLNLAHQLQISYSDQVMNTRYPSKSEGVQLEVGNVSCSPHVSGDNNLCAWGEA